MNRIMDYRKAAGMTQGELAQVLGIAQSTLSQYETGKRSPDAKTVAILSDVFHVSPTQLLGLDLPEREQEAQFDLSKVRRIATVIEQDAVNLYLSAGWVLLSVESDYVLNSEGKDTTVFFTLGWPGDPEAAQAFEHLSPSDMRHVEEW